MTANVNISRSIFFFKSCILKYELKSAWLGAILKLATNDSKLRNRFDLKHPEYATTIVGFFSQTESKIGV